jgi:hypothetical protein
VTTFTTATPASVPSNPAKDVGNSGHSSQAETSFSGLHPTIHAPKPIASSVVLASTTVPLPTGVLSPEEELKDKKWRAKSLLQQLLAPRAAIYEFTAPTGENGSIPTLKVQGNDAISVMSPDNAQEALLMAAVLRALGHKDAYRILLPTRVSSSEPSSTPSQLPLSSAMDITTSDSTSQSTLSQNPAPFSLKLAKEDVQIAKNAAKSALATASAASSRWEEDQDSLALELELEFTQLDPQTRVELLKQLDMAEHVQLFESGARDERLARASKEAAFHNAQLAFDRARLGPYYFDPHTGSYQAMHSLAIPEPICQPRALHPTNPNLTIINPDLPLPNGFSYFPQTTADFHPNMASSLASNPHVAREPVSRAGASQGPLSAANRSSGKSNPKSRGAKATEISLSASNQSLSNPDSQPIRFPTLPNPRIEIAPGQEEYRYAIMDGYTQWLKKELESHRLASAPLDPYDTWARQFKRQWDVLQPQGCFDYTAGDQTLQQSSLSASTSLSAAGSFHMSGGGIQGTKHVSGAIKSVWRSHRKHLESENAVQIAMENAERSRRRARFGDPADLDIDPGKHLTRDERRKLQRNEKEHAKLKQLFLAQGWVESDEFALDQLSWYDFHTLFESLGVSVAHLLEEEAAKNQLPALIYGPNGQVRARSHKKGAARAAKLAAKKAAMEATGPQTQIPLSGPIPTSGTPSILITDSSSPSHEINRKKRARADDTLDQIESQQIRALSASLYEQQRHRAATTPSLDLNSNQGEMCQGCGATDNAEDFVHCSACHKPYHIFCIEEEIVVNRQWRCPSCS